MFRHLELVALGAKTRVDQVGVAEVRATQPREDAHHTWVDAAWCAFSRPHFTTAGGLGQSAFLWDTAIDPLGVLIHIKCVPFVVWASAATPAAETAKSAAKTAKIVFMVISCLIATSTRDNS